MSHETLRYAPTGVAVRASPQHKEPDLQRALEGFEVEQSFLLRHGQHEYLFATSEGSRRIRLAGPASDSVVRT